MLSLRLGLGSREEIRAELAFITVFGVAPRPAVGLLGGVVVRWALPRASRGVPRLEVAPPLGEHLPHLEDQAASPRFLEG
jgi:hypothetical protein